MKDARRSARNGAVIAGTLLVALPAADLVLGVLRVGPVHALVAFFGLFFLFAAAFGGAGKGGRP